MSSFHPEDAWHQWLGKHGTIPHHFGPLHHFLQQWGCGQSGTCPKSGARPRRAESPALLCWPGLAPSRCSTPSLRALLSEDKATFVHANVTVTTCIFGTWGSTSKRWGLLGTHTTGRRRRRRRGGEEDPDKEQSSKNSKLLTGPIGNTFLPGKSWEGGGPGAKERG